jgi:hypothetical protein
MSLVRIGLFLFPNAKWYNEANTFSPLTSPTMPFADMQSPEMPNMETPAVKPMDYKNTSFETKLAAAVASGDAKTFEKIKRIAETVYGGKVEEINEKLEAAAHAIALKNAEETAAKLPPPLPNRGFEVFAEYKADANNPAIQEKLAQSQLRQEELAAKPQSIADEKAAAFRAKMDASYARQADLKGQAPKEVPEAAEPMTLAEQDEARQARFEAIEATNDAILEARVQKLNTAKSEAEFNTKGAAIDSANAQMTAEVAGMDRENREMERNQMQSEAQAEVDRAEGALEALKLQLADLETKLNAPATSMLEKAKRKVNEIRLAYTESKIEDSLAAIQKAKRAQTAINLAVRSLERGDQ